MSEMIRESHSIVPPDPKLDKFERVSLLIMGVSIAVMFTGMFYEYDGIAKQSIFWSSLLGIIGGGLFYGIHKHLKHKPGIQNHHLTHNSVTSRGAWGWLLGVIITVLYTLHYFFSENLTALTRLFDPLSELVRGGPAVEWFMYGTLYTVAVVVMGVKAIVKYRHSRYQIIRTCSIIFSQLILAWLIPHFMVSLKQPEFYPNYFWPLEYKSLMPGKASELWTDFGTLGKFVLGWGIIMFLVATPILTYFYGKRWYCSWVCGCGGLANTAGDSWRQLSDKSSKAWKVERIMIYSVLVFVVVMTGLVWASYAFNILPEFSKKVKLIYGYLIGSAFSGVIGVGFYPIMGTRVWCRFGCPMAAVLGFIQRFKSRFRITTNGAQCISCGNCSKYCEMGIDVRWYAQRGQDIVRASCVGCGMCSAVCPRGVLNLENGPTHDRVEYKMDLLGAVKSRQLENQNK